MTAPVAESQAAIAAGSQSFAAAAKLMPRGIREDTIMLYAWCRHADDVVDGQELGSAPQAGGDPEERLARLKAETLEALHGTGPMTPPFAALQAVARRHDFPDRWPMDLIDGFAMDVEGRAYRTLNDTLDYSYHVAGVVGVMMARVMGVRDQAVLDRACDLGLAFQLTNIARDVIDDARIGRVYLPGDWLDEAGATIEGDIPSPQLYAVILRLLDAAEPYYASAFAGLPALPARCAWSIAAAARIYRAIGARIRKGGPEAYRQRIGTSGAAKAGLALRALGDAGRSRVLPPKPLREGLWTRPRA
ncbi:MULTISPECIES: phytoene/squalene synthase family protein [unclassified Paracoccus (in: a-proteobacteria)]|uniref:phytoene/squalene synthase family protein n=1 Tax=unclassified Paracoccus (in: a-proteobacteria) TaxID=2688777 RepID=UPI0016029D39|nr:MULTISPECIES: phytoene/squalene synthase family protein [unclassified Paracoccus (in: a-proteobacteria)]MBB1491310.1 phytoene/squalene synthase family protein [Paracoccus sp. MC1854]MBB1498088.1 phytoene/squalene synthase family protein [Paracoccus sp. MC1862]QQO43476.1 phytoene/squalene synthase family protein [Paracoccus sp. MC1862]